MLYKQIHLSLQFMQKKKKEFKEKQCAIKDAVPQNPNLQSAGVQGETAKLQSNRRCETRTARL